MTSVVWFGSGLLFAAAYLAFVGWRSETGRFWLAVGLVIAGLDYVGFALWAGYPSWIFYEAIGAALFCLFAWLGMRRSPLWLAAGWGLHPLWDVVLHSTGTGAEITPDWYVVACISFDLLVAVFVLTKRREL